MRSKTNVWKYVMKLIMNKRANHKTRMVHVCQLSRLNWTICSIWHETANKCIWFADVHHQDFYWIKFINKSRYDDVQQHLMILSALEHELSSNTKATIYQLIFINQPSIHCYCALLLRYSGWARLYTLFDSYWIIQLFLIIIIDRLTGILRSLLGSNPNSLLHNSITMAYIPKFSKFFTKYNQMFILISCFFPFLFSLPIFFFSSTFTFFRLYIIMLHFWAHILKKITYKWVTHVDASSNWTKGWTNSLKK